MISWHIRSVTFLKLLLVLELTVQGNNKKLTGREKKRNYKDIYMRYNLFFIQCIHLSLNLIIQGYKENVEIVVLKKE